MKKTDLLKTLLPGILPLLVFILADEIWGTEIGLYVAVSFGIVQLLVIYIKEKKLDKFVLFDTLLIVGMGAVSIILENDIFFKLKPGVIGIILIAILGVSAFSPKNIMMSMSQRYLKGVQINEQQQEAMNRSIKLMFWIFLAHTILIFYSAFFMSKEAWVFISGVLFYIVFGIFFAIELGRNLLLKKKNKIEFLAEVDKEGKVISRMTREEAHNKTHKMHPVIHAHVINSAGEVLLQKRNNNKKIQPSKWDTSVGGHISFDEKIELALERETKEELGLKNLKFQFITKYVWKSDIETELVFVFLTKHEEFKFKQNDEVDQVKFWSFSEIKKNLGKNVFTPNFEVEFNNILSKIKIQSAEADKGQMTNNKNQDSRVK